ncbi:MAG: chorismate lyase [Chromatiales bacterium]|nr:chorismate lyase [Chromatiales bacterium]
MPAALRPLARGAGAADGPGARGLRAGDRPATAQARAGADRPARCAADSASRTRPACVREIEITCGAIRWIFAQSVLPQSTVQQHPWLRELGDNGLGESLSADRGRAARAARVRRAAARADLAVRGQRGAVDPVTPLWARRAVYRLGGRPILVQEVFLPGLGRCDVTDRTRRIP